MNSSNVSSAHSWTDFSNLRSCFVHSNANRKNLVFSQRPITVLFFVLLIKFFFFISEKVEIILHQIGSLTLGMVHELEAKCFFVKAAYSFPIGSGNAMMGSDGISAV